MRDAYPNTESAHKEWRRDIGERHTNLPALARHTSMNARLNSTARGQSL
jgi:hypothetical protein